MTVLIKSCLFIVCVLFITCTTSTNKNLHKKLNDEFIDNLKLKSNQAKILFYPDFLKSKMEISDCDSIITKNRLDTIFHFIGNRKNDSCSFIPPDGEIQFYENDIWLVSMQFVLTDSCDGFYTDFTKNPRKYSLTAFGKSTLLKLKSKLLNRSN